jgi:hypothetical protein
MTCSQTKRIEPLNAVMRSAIRLSMLCRRTRSCSINAGLMTGLSAGRRRAFI